MAQISWTLIVFLVCFCVSSVFWCPVETLHTGSRSDPDPDDNGDNQQPAMADLLRRLFTVSESKEQDQQDANTANDISIIPAFDTESLDTAVAEHTWQFPINGRMHPALHKRTPNYFCGPRIPEILATICGKNNHGRPHWPRVRRSIQDSLEKQEPQAASAWPFISSEKAHQVLPSPEVFQRKLRGIYDECCAKPCTINELKSYCGTKNTRNKLDRN